jgi:hypothetical protein
MFFLAGAAAGVLEHLGSLQHIASGALKGSAVSAAVSGETFKLGSSTAANSPAAANSSADGGVGGVRASPGIMNALISIQGHGGAGGAMAAPGGSTATTITNADSGHLLERLIRQQARWSAAAAAGQSLSTIA